MEKEKETLMKTLKDQNLRAETRKFTANLIHPSRTSKSFISSNNKRINTSFDKSSNKTDINNISSSNNIINELNMSEKVSAKKLKKVKKKKNVMSEEKIIKSGDKIIKGKKYKLLSYQKLDDIKDDKKEQKEIKISENNEKKNKPIGEVKPIIKKDKDTKISLESFKYNYDNLIGIGLHGNKFK